MLTKKVDELKQLEIFLHNQIPLTKSMKLSIVEFDGDLLTTKAPLEENINDKGSVFGGSSSALMIISAWSLIKLKCNDHNIDADIVIHKNTTTWHKAMHDDLLILAKINHANNFVTTLTKINKNKHQRIECKIELVDKQGTIYSTMLANYVIIPKKPSKES